MHTESLHSEIKPFVYAYSPLGNYMFIKTNSSINPRIVQTIKNTIKQVAPNDLIELNFLEDDLNSLYSKEQTTEKLIGYSSLIAIIISCLGLFGLSFMVYKKDKRDRNPQGKWCSGIRNINHAQQGFCSMGCHCFCNRSSYCLVCYEQLATEFCL